MAKFNYYASKLTSQDIVDEEGLDIEITNFLDSILLVDLDHDKRTAFGTAIRCLVIQNAKELQLRARGREVQMPQFYTGDF